LASLTKGFKELGLKYSTLNYYDFDNVIAQEMCSTGLKRTPIQLFHAYTPMSDESNSSTDSSSNLPKSGHSLEDLNFPVHLYTRAELVELSVPIFEHFNLFQELQTTPQVLKTLLTEMAH
jgi:hypothetical protein